VHSSFHAESLSFTDDVDIQPVRAEEVVLKAVIPDRRIAEGSGLEGLSFDGFRYWVEPLANDRDCLA
jgi:hypothetical protein